jgi:hypothetical protein
LRAVIPSRSFAQAGRDVPDITGSWERARDASIPAAPQPPLKAQYVKEYQAKLQRIREANAKGQPIAERVVQCLPDGMPGMMAGPFPMEILQSKGQVTVIQEAIRRFGASSSTAHKKLWTMLNRDSMAIPSDDGKAERSLWIRSVFERM